MTSKNLSIIPIKSAIEASKKTKKAAPTPPAAPATVSRRKPRKPTKNETPEEEEESYELFSETESEEEESEEEEEEVKAKQYKPRTPPAVKKERSEKQKKVFELALQRREENRKLRKAEKDAKIVNEEKIIKKGLQLKKKQIIKEAILNDSESDVDIPNEIVQKVLKKKSKIKQVIEPQEKPPTVFKHSFNFV